MRIPTVVLALALTLLGSATVSAGSSWTTPRTVWAPGGDVGYSITWDGDGRYHVAADGGGLGESGLWYVTKGDAEQITPGDRSWFDSAIAVSQRNGRQVVRIVWTDAFDPDAVWLTRNDTGAWVSSRLWIGEAASPSIASLGRGLGVSFIDGQDRLRYLTWDPVAGPSAPAILARECCQGHELAIRAGRVAIAYSEAATSGPDRLRLARQRTDGSWSRTTVDPHDTSGPSIELDGNGRARVAYDTAGSGVFLARQTSSGWALSQVFPEPYQDPSLALDGGGRPWVVAVRWRERDHHATAPKLRQAHPKATAIGVPFTPGNLGLLHLAFVNGKPAVTHAAFGEGDHSVGGVFLTRKR